MIDKIVKIKAGENYSYGIFIRHISPNIKEVKIFYPKQKHEDMLTWVGKSCLEELNTLDKLLYL